MSAAAIRMTWSQLLFLHWPVAADRLAALLPAGVEVDEHDGTAWIGLVPFSMPLIQPAWWPGRAALPGMTRFHECNVRTYVTCGSEQGVWFFSLDAASWLAVRVARARFSLPYRHARIRLERDGDEIDYAVDRRDGPGTLRCRWRIGERLPPSEPGGIAHFLTERYALFTHRNGRIHRGRVAHEPWPLREAELLELDDTLVKEAGFEVEGPPTYVHAADPIAVEAWNLERV